MSWINKKDIFVMFLILIVSLLVNNIVHEGVHLIQFKMQNVPVSEYCFAGSRNEAVGWVTAEEGKGLESKGLGFNGKLLFDFSELSAYLMGVLCSGLCCFILVHTYLKLEYKNGS